MKSLTFLKSWLADRRQWAWIKLSEVFTGTLRSALKPDQLRSKLIPTRVAVLA
jgi:hypothetical protein